MPKIIELHAYIAADTAPDDEGLCAERRILLDGKAYWLPMVGADTARMLSMRDSVRTMCKAANLRIVLARFTAREDIEVFEP